MAQYLPPNENVPIFDNVNFLQGDTPLTYNTASQYFLTYPTAQGTENLQTVNVAGTSTFNGTITITNGTTSNTLSNTDWTGTIKTQLSTQNLTHYLNMSDSSSTGQGNPQKSALIMANPSTGVITASGFVGNLTGTASQASLINVISDNSSTVCYIPFVKTASSTGTQQQLYTDDVTGPLTYQPSSNTLTCNYVVYGTSTNTATWVIGTPGTITIALLQSKDISYNVTVSSNTTINTLAFSANSPNNVQINIYVFNSSGNNITLSNLTVATGLTGTVKRLYNSNVIIPSGGYGQYVVSRSSGLSIYMIDAFNLL